MGALSLPIPWIAEDDLVLKNAIEAGASLESLAKGAVQFSRRFTIKELQDRWLALLYDPHVSTKAAEQMVELERSASNLASKSNRADNSKGNKNLHGKRKAESVRRCYYAMRKRVCSEPLNPVMRDGDPCAVNGFPIEQHITYEDHMEQTAALPNNLTSHEHISHNMFEGGAIQANLGHSSRENIYSDFEAKTIFNPSSSDCETTLQHLQFVSPPPAMSDWKTFEGISLSEIPEEFCITGKKVQTGDPFVIPDGGDAGGIPESGVIHTDPEMNNHILAEDKLPNMLEAEEQTAADMYVDIPSSAGLEEKIDAGETCLGVSNVQNSSDFQIPTSTACVNSKFPEYRDGVICCLLNTEDQEIPCNDHVIFPSKPRPLSSNRKTPSETNNQSLYGKDNAGPQSSRKGQSTMKRDPKRFGESHPASLTRDLDVGLKFGVQFENSIAERSLGLRISNNGCGDPCQSSQVVKKEPSELPLSRQSGCCVAEKPGQIADLGHLPTAARGINQEAQTSSALRNQELHAPCSTDYMAAEPGGEPLLADPEEQFSESDADIPDFSDVESMILDMDLGPEDQDLFCSKEVARYQREDGMRVVIRLEQNAHSYMQRAIASHGAFAILYGRHSKHYIKKPEVLLGRATEEAPVDIDLGREGHTNTISRKQATIKMDKDGAFIFYNSGRSPIYVNGREISRGHSLSLQSNSLIEIRGMPFIFETNQARVNQHLENAARLEGKRLNI